MEGSRVLSLDVFALVDADTDEARTFTTYLNYWLALAELVGSYGPFPYPALLAELESRKAFRALSGKQAAGDGQELRALMLNAWNSELALHLIELADTERLWVANQWGQVQSYFATSRAATAWSVARDGSAPDRHRALLNALAAQITGSRLYPQPWGLCCTGIFPAVCHHGFTTAPQAIHNLASGGSAHDRTGLMLRTTREKEIKKRVEQVKRDLRCARAPAGERQRQDALLAPTTVFDFAWRMRTRSNYGDPAMFYVGTLSAERSHDFAIAVRSFTGATMFLFEALIAQKARKVVEEAAVHFISRDRSRLAEQIILPRLRTLGMLAQTAA